MPQRGDNPNEVLFEPGSKWAHFNVDNYYDADSSLHRPVDEVLAEIEEECNCPLAYLEFRRKNEARIHKYIYTNTPQPIQRMPSYDALLKYMTERDRIEEYLNHEKEYT